MERYVEEGVEGVSACVVQGVQAFGESAVAVTLQQQSGLVLLFVKRDEVTSDWLSFFL